MKFIIPFIIKTSVFLSFLFFISSAPAETKSDSPAPETDSLTEEESVFYSDKESASSAKGAADSNPIEKINVTGSRIKRIDLEGLNPVVSFSSEDLDDSGYHSIGDFLRDTNISSFGVSRGTAGSSATGDSYMGVNGEPALILINGLRVTKDPELHNFDLNQVPLEAVERIDVLKGGAGAIYGSDAVGGVINFIIKKDFSGAKVFASLTPTLYPIYRGSLKGSLDDYFSGSEISAGAVFGDRAANWSYIGSITTRYQENIRMDQRKWSSGLSSSFSPYATLVFSDDSMSNNCPEAGCPRFDYTPYADLMPRYFQVNGFTRGEYKLNDVTLYTQLLASYKNSQYFFAPIPVSAGAKPALEVPANNQMPAAGGRAFRLSHRFIEAGRRDTPVNYWMADLTLGAKGYLSKVWDYDFSVKGAHIIKNRTQKNVLLRDQTTSAIQTGAYDPFNPTKEGLKGAVYTAKSKANSSLLFSSFDFSGQAGGFDIATGLQAYFQRYQNKADIQSRKSNILSDAGSDGSGNRYVGSYYVEAIKKLHSTLELQLAWRADYYSDFGLTDFGLREFIASDSNSLKFLDYLKGTPKLAFRFQPDPQFLLRGSVGSSFKAPELSWLYGSNSSGFPWLFDTPGCVSQIESLQQDMITYIEDSIKEITDENEKENTKAAIQKNFQSLDKTIITSIVAYGEDAIEKGDLSSEQEKMIEDQKLVEFVSSLYRFTAYESNINPCQPQQYSSVIQSNKNLDETRAITASLGSVVELNEDLNISLDLIYIAKNGIPSSGIVDSDGIGKKFLDVEALKGKPALEEYGIITERKPSGELANVKTKYLNLTDSRKLFLDFNLNARASGAYLKNNFTFFLIDKQEEFPGFGLDSLTGNFGRPRWRNAGMLGWQNKKHHVFLKALSSASFKRASDPSTYFPLSTRFDANYEYMVDEKTSLQLNVYNFLNLGLNFKNESEKLISLSLDVPYDPSGWSLDTRTDLNIFGINGAYFTVKVSHLFN